MYLFSRRARLSGGKFRDSMAWAVGITEKVTQTTGLQVGLWSQTFSPAVGTLVWSTFVPDLTTLEAATDKLTVDDAYNDLVDRGVEFVIPGSIDDTLAMIIHGQPDPNRHVEYVAAVRTTISGGNLARGIALGVEIAQRAEKITGLPTAFLGDSTGNYGGVTWLTAFANVAELERAEQKLNTDQSFIELIDTKAAGVYAEQPGASTQLVYRRIL
jgi:hypothetical protein